jgi:hypothetical protein
MMSCQNILYRSNRQLKNDRLHIGKEKRMTFGAPESERQNLECQKLELKHLSRCYEWTMQ